MTELFPKTEMSSKSPRLKWMEKHAISVAYDSEFETWEAWWDDKFRSLKLHMRNCLWSEDSEYYVTAETELEAIERLAENRGIELWNERQPAPRRYLVQKHVKEQEYETIASRDDFREAAKIRDRKVAETHKVHRVIENPERL